MEQRYQAVLAFVQDGWKVTEVADRLGVTRQSVHNWIDRYERGGLPALADRSHRPQTCSHRITPHINTNSGANLRQSAQDARATRASRAVRGGTGLSAGHNLSLGGSRATPFGADVVSETSSVANCVGAASWRMRSVVSCRRTRVDAFWPEGEARG
jgi:transposase-like protein